MGVLVDVLVIAAVVAFWVVWILATARALRAPAAAYAAVGRRKPQTVLLVVFFLVVGALYFLLVIQRELDAVDLPDDTATEHGIEVAQVEIDDDIDEDVDGDATRA